MQPARAGYTTVSVLTPSPIDQVRRASVSASSDNQGITQDSTEGMKLRMDDGWLTLPQALGYLATGETTIRRLIRAGRIRAMRTSYGRRILLVSRADCHQVIMDDVARAGFDTACDNPSLAPKKKAKKSAKKSTQKKKKV